MLLTTVAWLALGTVQGQSLLGDYARLLEGVVVVSAGAALGKVVGLFYWNLVFKRTARRLWRIIGSERPRCGCVAPIVR